MTEKLHREENKMKFEVIALQICLLTVARTTKAHFQVGPTISLRFNVYNYYRHTQLGNAKNITSLLDRGMQ